MVRLSLLIVAAALAAQDASRPAFEVVSIKQSNALERGGRSGWEPGGRFRGVNVPGRMLIQIAYGTPSRTLLDYQVEGAPGWLSSARYDIVGKVRTDLASTDPAVLGSNGPRYLRSLLEDRFRLRVHRESRRLPRYRLVRTRTDAFGPRLRRSTCAAAPEFCKLEYGAGHYVFEGVPLARLAEDLSGMAGIGRVIVDDTRLAGGFDLDLEWSVEQNASDKPSIFTALQEQLGLRLEAERGPVDVVVIDGVERPMED